MLLWISEGRPLTELRAVLRDAAPEALVSAATIWEIEIKRASGRLEAPADLLGLVFDSGFDQLPIHLEHARAAARLPPLHGDPFDRMLIAQAQLEGLTLITADRAIEAYDVATLMVERG